MHSSIRFFFFSSSLSSSDSLDSLPFSSDSSSATDSGFTSSLTFEKSTFSNKSPNKSFCFCFCFLCWGVG